MNISLIVFWLFEILLLRILFSVMYTIFKIGLFEILMSNFLGFLKYIWKIRPLSNVGLVKIFSHSIGYLSVLLTVSFALQKLLSFRSSHVFIVALSICATGVIFGNWSSVSMRWSLLPTFPSIRFSQIYI